LPHQQIDCNEDGLLKGTGVCHCVQWTVRSGSVFTQPTIRQTTERFQDPAECFASAPGRVMDQSIEPIRLAFRCQEVIRRGLTATVGNGFQQQSQALLSTLVCLKDRTRLLEGRPLGRSRRFRVDGLHAMDGQHTARLLVGQQVCRGAATILGCRNELIQFIVSLQFRGDVPMCVNTTLAERW
jgi:hypothetical protein